MKKFSFKHCWTASTVKDNNMCVISTKTCRFTQYSNEEFSPDDSFDLSIRVDERKGADLSFGIVPTDSIGGCQNFTPGEQEIRGSVACILRDGKVLLVSNDRIFFSGNCNTAEPTTIGMSLRARSLSFRVDKRTVNSDELQLLKVDKFFHIGVGMTKEGQQVSIPESLNSPLSKDKDKEALARALSDILQRLADDSGKGLRDNLKSINCSPTDEVAVCVKTLPATSVSKAAVDAQVGASFTVQILRTTSKPIFIGLLHEDAKGHGHLCLGNVDLRNSLGYISTGHVMMSSIMLFETKPFGERSVVTLTLKGGKLSIHLDGQDVSPTGLDSIEFTNKFRFGLTLTERGQAVKIGTEPLTDVEKNFLKSKGVAMEECRWRTDSSFGKCPQQQHELYDMTQYESDWNCDVCTSEYHAKTVLRYRCERCDFDKCKQCLDRENQNTLSNQGVPSLPPTPTTPISTTDPTQSTPERSVDEEIERFQICRAHITFSRDKILGQGAFGSVYEGVYDGDVVAIKELVWQEEDARQRREILIGRTLSHPNIANVHGWCKEGNKLILVLPLFRDGSLATALKKAARGAGPNPAQGGPLGWKGFFEVSLGILRGLRYMADRKPNPIIHRDLKPENILMRDGKPIITDFGLAKEVSQLLSSTTAVQGTPVYMSCEQFCAAKDITPATDIYSFGCMAWELLHAPLRPRNHCKTPFSIMNEVSCGTPLDMRQVPQELRFIERCFAVNPAERPTAAELVERFGSAAPHFHA